MVPTGLFFHRVRLDQIDQIPAGIFKKGTDDYSVVLRCTAEYDALGLQFGVVLLDIEADQSGGRDSGIKQGFLIHSLPEETSLARAPVPPLRRHPGKQRSASGPPPRGISAIFVKPRTLCIKLQRGFLV